KAPSCNSSAVRWAICSRDKRSLPATTLFRMPLPGMVFFGMPLPGIAESFRLHDAMNEDRRGHDMFRIDGSYGDNFFDFRDRGSGGHGHDGIEIPGGQAI